MSRAARRRAHREKSSGRGGTRRNWTPLWIMGGSVAAALLILAVITSGDGTGQLHPAPRLDAHAMHVMPAARYSASPQVAETYAMAAEIPGVLDGIYCFCFCHQNFGHYSLLDCFTNDHGAGCDICLDEAVLAYQMTQDGASLDGIRSEVDRRYRRT